MKQKGFTLIELLVAMAIIAILTTIAYSSYRNAQIRARDAQRKSDLNQIAKSLELFYADKKMYPPISSASDGNIAACPYVSSGTSTNCEWGSTSTTGELTDSQTVYFRQLPKDPSGGKYYYRTLNTGQAFQLFAHLENEDDKSCIGGDCKNPPALTASPDCGTDNPCNFAITSTNVTATD